MARAWPGAHDVTGVRVVALAEDHLLGLERARHRHLRHAREVLLGELGEDRDAAEEARARVLGRRRHLPRQATQRRARARAAAAPPGARRATPAGRRARAGAAARAPTSSTPAVTSRMRTASSKASPGVQPRGAVVVVAAALAVGEQRDGDRRAARPRLDLAEVALGGRDLAGDEAQPGADARGLVRRGGGRELAQQAAALGAGVLEALADGDDRAGDVLRALGALAHLGDLESRLSAVCSLRSGTRSSNCPLEFDETGRGDDVAAELVGDADDLGRRAVDLARRRREHELGRALDGAAVAAVGARAPAWSGAAGRSRCRREPVDGSGRVGAAGGGARRRGGVGVAAARRAAARRPAVRGGLLGRRRRCCRRRRRCRCRSRSPPFGIEVAITTTSSTLAATPSAGSVTRGHLMPRRLLGGGGAREAPLHPRVERAGEGGVRGGALVAQGDGELGQVGEVGVDRAAGERVVERGQLAGEGVRRAHRWPFAASGRRGAGGCRRWRRRRRGRRPARRCRGRRGT